MQDVKSNWYGLKFHADYRLLKIDRHNSVEPLIPPMHHVLWQLLRSVAEQVPVFCV